MCKKKKLKLKKFFFKIKNLVVGAKSFNRISILFFKLKFFIKEKSYFGSVIFPFDTILSFE